MLQSWDALGNLGAPSRREVGIVLLSLTRKCVVQRRFPISKRGEGKGRIGHFPIGSVSLPELFCAKKCCASRGSQPAVIVAKRN